MHALARVLISLGIILVPAGLGWLCGALQRRWLNRRVGGVLWPAGLLLLLAGLAALLDMQTSVVGIWDAVTMAVALVGGWLCAAHRAFDDPRAVGVAAAATALACVGVEILCRIGLGPAPAFPDAANPHLLFSAAARASTASRLSATHCQTAACGAIYASQPGRWNQNDPRAQDFHPDPAARLHILHLGDSVTVGSDVDGRFTRDLEALEPGVQHINAAIGASGTDTQLAIAGRWLALHHIDAVVLHLNPNDAYDMDVPTPCANWQSLLVYDATGPRLRYTSDHTPDPEHMRWRMLFQDSPPPYLLCVGVEYSVAAAHLAAAFVRLGHRLGFDVERDEMQGRAHIVACLGALRDQLAARKIPFVVDVLHSASPVDEPRSAWAWSATTGLGLGPIDGHARLSAAVAGGAQPYLDISGHFNAAGHAIMAGWLHQALAPTIARLSHR